jgi:hypothetical protein
MRPTTPHYVLTVENSITYGRHFYAVSTISDSVWGAVHAFVLGCAVTNTLHDNTRTLFRRVMAMWYDHFIGVTVKCPSEHVSDIFNS